jgi:hypothetical protein
MWELVSSMRLRLRQTALAVLPLAMAACASQPMQTAGQTTRRGIDEAAHAPFEDLNLVRSRIPKVLIVAVADPYARPQPVGCEGLKAELAKLDDALGPDFDVAKPQRSMADRSADFVSTAGSRALKDAAESWIPMRNWVRYMTGAEQHSKAVTQAIAAGQARRAYLKGLAQSEGCLDLGPAQPVYLFPAPPHTPSSVAQN